MLFSEAASQRPAPREIARTRRDISGVWLATELDADGDILFGLADLGEPELGYFSLEEMASVRLPFGLGIERDMLFSGDFPISVWAEAAREAGSIHRAERIIYAAARARREGV